MASKDQLLAMGLTPYDHNDEKLMNANDWNRKKQLHAAVLASTLCQDKPSGDEHFATTKPTSPGAAKCNIVIPIAKLSAVVTEGNPDKTDKAISEEFLLAKKKELNGARRISLGPMAKLKIPSI